MKKKSELKKLDIPKMLLLDKKQMADLEVIMWLWLDQFKDDKNAKSLIKTAKFLMKSTLGSNNG